MSLKNGGISMKRRVVPAPPIRVEGKHVKTKPLLTITVQDLDSVPVVTYKGKEIKGKISISYEWLTRSVGEDGGHCMCIKHYTNKHDAPSIDSITLDRWDNPPSLLNRT